MSDTDGAPDLAESLGANQWVLDAAGSTPPIDTGETVTLSFEGGRLSGRAPCNRYSATCEVVGDRIRMGAVVSTRMACDEATSSAERAYFEALALVARVEVHPPGPLVLTGEHVTLRFDPPERTTAESPALD